MRDFVGGYAGQILYVNLTEGTTEKIPLDPAFAANYIGGRGFSSRMLLDRVKPGIDSLGPDNVVVIASGPLNGTPAPSSGRLTVAAKSPMTGGYAKSEVGGNWGVELKRAGFDAIIVEGKAEKPVYLAILDGEVSIKDASHLWGKNTKETEQGIRDDFGDKQTRVVAKTWYVMPAL